MGHGMSGAVMNNNYYNPIGGALGQILGPAGAPAPAAIPSQPVEWCLRRQFALLMILIGLALYIWSL